MSNLMSLSYYFILHCCNRIVDWFFVLDSIKLLTRNTSNPYHSLKGQFKRSTWSILIQYGGRKLSQTKQIEKELYFFLLWQRYALQLGILEWIFSYIMNAYAMHMSLLFMVNFHETIHPQFSGNVMFDISVSDSINSLFENGQEICKYLIFCLSVWIKFIYCRTMSLMAAEDGLVRCITKYE